MIITFKIMKSYFFNIIFYFLWFLCLFTPIIFVLLYYHKKFGRDVILTINIFFSKLISPFFNNIYKISERELTKYLEDLEKKDFQFYYTSNTVPYKLEDFHHNKNQGFCIEYKELEYLSGQDGVFSIEEMILNTVHKNYLYKFEDMLFESKCTCCNKFLHKCVLCFSEYYFRVRKNLDFDFDLSTNEKIFRKLLSMFKK